MQVVGCSKIPRSWQLPGPIHDLGEWLGILETTGQIILVPPYFENFGKRLIKSPKIYLGDPGLACHLLGIESERELARSTFLGPIFEGYVASEIIKSQINLGRRRELYFFRDQRGLEVDFLVPTGAENLLLVEAKASQTVYPSAAASLLNLAKSIESRDVRRIVVHGGKKPTTETALTEGALSMDVSSFVHMLYPQARRR